jgi:broad specificity phosphatase PhoE
MWGERHASSILDGGGARSISELAQSFPKAMVASHTHPVGYHLPGAEDPHAIVVRAVSCFSDRALISPSGRVLVVMHATLIRLGCAVESRYVVPPFLGESLRKSYQLWHIETQQSSRCLSAL